MTQREFYEFATNVFATVDVEGKEDAMAYIAKATAALDAKNAKAKERAAEKRMKALVESEVVTKATVKVDGRKLTAYAKA